MRCTGGRNAHLILYEAPLETAVLFGIRADASVVPPEKLDLMGVPPARLLGELEAGQDPVAKYAEMRASMEKQNRPAEDDKISGTEGTVWYSETPKGKISMWKCKPESVEAIHWAAGINKEAVRATCWNYLESGDNLTYDTLLPLLLEEYDPHDIERFRGHIEECIGQVRVELEFKEGVLAQYDSLPAGLSILTDKGAVMRLLSRHFGNHNMRKVFSIILNNRGKK